MDAAALCRERADRRVIGVQSVPEIPEAFYNGIRGVKIRDVVRELVSIIEYLSKYRFEIFCLYGFAHVGRCGLRDLGRDCVLLCVLIECERLFLIKKCLLKVVHVVGEVVLKDDRGVVFAGADSFYGFFCAVRETPADLVAAAEIIEDVFRHIDMRAVLEIYARVERSESYLDPARVGIRIAVSVDVHPCVEGRKHRNSHYNSQRKKAPAY